MRIPFQTWRALVGALLVAFFGASHTAAAAPLDAKDVPGELKPWMTWALRGHEAEACTSFRAGDADTRECAWPGKLTLTVDAKGGRFTQTWHVEAKQLVRLPGDEKRWPLDVKIGAARALVVARGGVPQIELDKGEQTVTGAFLWDSPPESLQIPPSTGLLSLTVRGARIDAPSRDGNGIVWLHKSAEKEEGEKLEITVHRKITDEIPLVLATRIQLDVAGKSREVLLGKTLPDGFVPMALDAPLPARVEADGRLRVQVRPGTWQIMLTARGDGLKKELARPKPEGPWREGDEVWVFEAKNDLRVVDVQGVSAIDPQQTTLPAEWKALPAYPMKLGDVMRFEEKRRGDADPPPNQLSLVRSMWLDFDGSGYTISDAVRGSLTQGTRLEMAPPTVLGRVATRSANQFITHLGDANFRGVEIRQGELDVSADSRLTGDPSDIPAVGWKHDFHQVSGELHLPPGWRLLHASGVDEVPGTWLRHWSLFELFMALILGLAIARLYGLPWGALALVMLALTFPEENAPKWTWVVVLAFEALVRVLPKGAVSKVLRVGRVGALVALVVATIPFLVHHVREGMYPVLANPGATMTAIDALTEGETRSGLTARDETKAENDRSAFDFKKDSENGKAGGDVVDTPNAPAAQAATLPAQPADADGKKLGQAVDGRYGPKARVVAKPAGSSYGGYWQMNAETYDPNAVVQTGPGLPKWNWTTVSLKWSGPVESTQRIKLTLLSPAMNLALAFLRAVLVVLLVLRMLPFIDRFLPPSLRRSGAALAAATVTLVILFAPRAASAQNFPPQELLDDLRDRVLAPAPCQPTCASAGRMLIEVRGKTLRARMDVDALARTAIVLPGSPEQWTPETITLDGQPAKAILRGDGGKLWLALDAGSHQVLVEGPMPDREIVQLALPTKPHRVEATAEGWTVAGVHEDGLSDDNLQFTRIRSAAGTADGAALQPGVLPSFVRIERTLRLGLNWQVETRVVRATPLGSAIVLEVPLLPGESVTTADVRVVGGKALVNMAPNATDVSWRSVLEQRSPIKLVAPKQLAATEVWRLDVGPIWHASPKGIPFVHTAAAALPEWQPWPGEEATVDISRPEGVAGQSLTIDRVAYDVNPGLRATDASVTLTIRASRGLPHTMTLPDGALLESLTINGAAAPIRQEGRKVTVPIVPGTQSIRVAWRQPDGIALMFRTPTIDLGAPSVNVVTTLAPQGSRWILLLGGPRMGPAVLYWSLLVVLLVVAAALGRVTWTPLRTWHWMLLAIGLSQVEVVAGAVVVGWLLVLGWREKKPAIAGGALVFDLRQVAIVLSTFLALLVLVISVHQGLLGAPEMQIQGNGCSSGHLAWYQDRAGNVPDVAWVVSAPILVYRGVMLLWALWVALAVLRWLRWGWTAFTTEGAWKALPKPPPRPPMAPAGYGPGPYGPPPGYGPPQGPPPQGPPPPPRAPPPPPPPPPPPEEPLE
jgi:hypothetical protein